MSQDLSGFEKSVPTSRPATKNQGPVSAWDVDVSPFNRLLEQYFNNTQQLIDSFSNKMQEVLNTLREDRTQKEKKEQAHQDKVQQHYKTMAKDSTAMRELIAEIAEQIGKLQQTLQDVTEQHLKNLESMQKDIHEGVRSLTSQEGFLREGFNPKQLIQPMEKLTAIEENTLQNLQALTANLQQFRSSQESDQKQQEHLVNYLQAWEKKLENFENLLISLGARAQTQFPDKAFLENLFTNWSREQNHLITQHQTNYENDKTALEKIYLTTQHLLERQQKYMEEEKEFRRKDTILLWIFLGVAILFTISLFFLRR